MKVNLTEAPSLAKPEIDNKYIVVPISFLQNLAGRNLEVSSLEIKLEDIDNLFEILEKSISCLNLNNTVCNVDFIVSGNDIFIIEIGARIGATCIPEIISINTGIDIYSFLIDLALGKSPEFKPLVNKANAALLLKCDQSGFIKNIDISEEIEKEKRIIDLQVDVDENAYVKKFECGSDRVGHIIVKEENYYKSEKLARKMASKIKFSLK